jgi:hypothetical protein
VKRSSGTPPIIAKDFFRQAAWEIFAPTRSRNYRRSEFPLDDLQGAKYPRLKTDWEVVSMSSSSLPSDLALSGQSLANAGGACRL